MEESHGATPDTFRREYVSPRGFTSRDIPARYLYINQCHLERYTYVHISF